MDSLDTLDMEISQLSPLKKYAPLVKEDNGVIIPVNDQDSEKEKSMILTYNLFLRPPPIKNNKDDYKNERLDLFCSEILDKFDIICFQEVFGFWTKRKDKLIRRALKKGYSYFTESPEKSFFQPFHITEAGLLIISRHPILEQKFYPFINGDWPDSLGEKGVLYAKIQIKDSILHLFTTHLQATYSHNPKTLPKSIVTRFKQMEEMKKSIDTALYQNNYKQDDLIMLVGDLNINANYPYHPAEFLKSEFPNRNLSIAQDRYDEYQTLFKIMGEGYQIIDLVREKYQTSPATYGKFEINEKGETIPFETVLSHSCDNTSNQCLDYLLELRPYPQQIISPTRSSSAVLEVSNILSPSKYQNNEKLLIRPQLSQNLTVDKENINIEEFVVKNQHFTQLSDHFGISGQINYNKKKNNNFGPT